MTAPRVDIDRLKALCGSIDRALKKDLDPTLLIEEWDMIMKCVDELARLRAERQQLVAFARSVLADWPENSPEPEDIQEWAINRGLLVGEQRKPPCNPDNCFCAEYHGETDEVTCYRLSPLLADADAEKG